MQVITISKKELKDDLVIIPRKHYKELLRSQPEKLDLHLKQSLKEIHEGKAVGPFKEVSDLMNALQSKK